MANLNQRLKQLGYGSLNEFVGGIAAGVVTNRQVVEELADVLAGKIVNNLTPLEPGLGQSPLESSVRRSLGRDLIPQPTAYKALVPPRELAQPETEFTQTSLERRRNEP